MRTSALACLFTLLAGAAQAEWPTTSYVPIPHTAGSEERESLIADGFPGYATGAETFFNLTGKTMTVGALDRAALMQGAFAPLTNILRGLTIDSVALESAGFAAPLIEPLILDRSTGDQYYSLFWSNIPAPMRAGCGGVPQVPLMRELDSVRHLVEVNNGNFGYDLLRGGWNAGGRRQAYMLDYTSATFTHEVVHAIQRAMWTSGNCLDSDEIHSVPKWFFEGTADGIAHYLLSQRSPNAHKDWSFPRNQRSYRESLDAGGSNENNYGTGSFFQYLMEASAPSGRNGLPIMLKILQVPRGSLVSNDGLLKHIDSVVTSYAGTDRNGNPRTLYNVLPEFFTEFASYGGSRYNVTEADGQSSQPLNSRRWLHEIAGGCIRLKLTPGVTEKTSIDVKRLGIRCVRVAWSGFDVPVSLQIYGEVKGARATDLHIGEAVSVDASGKETFCYDATGAKKPRIALQSVHKCILRNQAKDVGIGGGATQQVASWVRGQKIEGEGSAYLIFSNVSKDIAETKDMDVSLVIGALYPKSQTTQMKPMEPEAEDVSNGVSNMNARVHALNMNGQRSLVDGQILSEGGSIAPGFDVPTGIMGDGSDEGILTIVRSQDYWVTLINADPSQVDKIGAMIAKNKEGFEANLRTPGGIGIPGVQAALRGTAMSGGMMADAGEFSQCGYDLSPTIRIEEFSDDALRFHVEGDLFSFGQAMMGAMGGGGGPCEGLDAAFVERASFTVTLPYGKLYHGRSTVRKDTSAAQDSYDGNFPDGAGFGGIAASLSMGGGRGDGDPGEETDEEFDDISAPQGSGGTADEGDCNCGCPDLASPASAACRLECRQVWTAQCGADPGAPAPAPVTQAERFRSLLQASGLAESAMGDMLSEDFGRMSESTREAILGGGN